MLTRFLLAFLFAAAGTFAQQKPNLAGDYTGRLDRFHVNLHLTVGPNGVLTGSVDSPDFNMFNVPCADFHLENQSLSFAVPSVGGKWMGFVNSDGTSLSGTWNQGSPMTLNFTRATPSSESGLKEVKWDGYTFKFLPGAQAVQVFQGEKLVGTIVTVNGDEKAVTAPGTDASKLKKSFDDWKISDTRSQAAAVAPKEQSETGVADGNKTGNTAPAAASSAIEWITTDHVTVHRADADVDINGKIATLNYKSTAFPFIMEYDKGGWGSGVLRSAKRGGRSFTSNGGWRISMAGRQIYNTADDGYVPGGNGGTIMQACRELVAAMNDAEADANRTGKAYKPIGKGALEDLINAHSLK